MSAPKGENLPELVQVMQRLLGPGGCPWDREQSLASMKPFVLEEAYEVVDALDAGAPDKLLEELGDLLLQVVFLSELARKEGWFGPGEVVAAIRDKLVRRHPWVFGEQEVTDADGAVMSWEAVKAAERGDRGALDGVPRALPALLRAVRVGEKASAVGFDWPDAGGARSKVDEELGELDRALARGERDEAERELGDVLFALASHARKLGLDPEAALRGTLDRFSARFGHAEARAREEGRALTERSAEELDALWSEAKRVLG